MAEEKEKKKERKPKRIAVKIIAQKDLSALVEWEAEGDLCRAYVPADKVEDGQCGEDVLAAGIPHGVPWEDVLPETPPREAVGKQLRQHGIWTCADIEKNIQGVQRAINQTTGLTPASLHTLASQYEAKKEM